MGVNGTAIAALCVGSPHSSNCQVLITISKINISILILLSIFCVFISDHIFHLFLSQKQWD